MAIGSGVELLSPAFEEGRPIPKEYTADGENISPPLKWVDPPEETRSFALVCYDPDAPRKVWTHWVAFNIPGVARELSEGVPAEPVRPNGLMQGKNDFGQIGYGGPAPPPGPPHHYHFHLYALDTMLRLKPGATRQELAEAVDGHILAQTELVGTYGRK
jgi:Raf kinase inhibitor-like YbhB/YbcL family protein